MSHFSRIKTKIKNKPELEEALFLLQYDVKEDQELKVTGSHGIKHEVVTADLAIGNQCQEITKSIEEKLGEVSYIETKPEYYQSQENVTLQHNQNENQE